MWVKLTLSLATVLVVMTSAQEVLRDGNLMNNENQTNVSSAPNNRSAISNEVGLDIDLNIMDTEQHIYTDTDNIATNTNHDGDDEVGNDRGVRLAEAGSVERENDDEQIPDTDVEEPETDPSGPEPIIVQTTYGRVEGHLLYDETLVGYFDIPYGKFDEYFEAPSEPVAWVDTINTSQHNTFCPQLQDDGTVFGSTDCLSLSIFTPANVENAPVLFHIHDGQFMSGSGNPLVYGPQNLVSKGVILVLPNYRLGPLGFLCLRNETAPGNAALKDLTLALQWTVNNIAAFGGDASNIVVSGEGMSGALVGYLALSPRSSLYFNKAIIESGSVLSHKVIDRDPLATALQLAKALTESETPDLKVIKDVEYEKLILSSKSIKFRPCVETLSDSFMNATAWEMLHENSINITFMIGSANHAGWYDFVEQEYTVESVEDLNDDMNHILPSDFIFKDEEERTAAALNIRRLYFGNNNITINNVDQLILYHTDATYLGPSIRTARPLVEAGATVYFYEFSFVGDLSHEPSARDALLNGAARGDTIKYLFTQDEKYPEVGSEDEKMVDLMTDLWVSFMKTGTPSAEDIAWNQLKEGEESEEEWLSIGAERRLLKGLHVDRLSLWSQLYREHFVDHNLAGRTTSQCSLALAATMILLLLTE